MNKHYAHGLWHRTRLPSLIVLVVLAAVCTVLTVLFLRANNMRMIELRQAVYAADEQDGDVEAALRALRQHVYGHMNTNVRSGSTTSEPPIQLVGRFNRAVAAEQARIAASGGSNRVYVEAQKACENPNVPLTVRAKCVQDYVAANGASVPQLQLPPKEIYTFDFVSPRWSPDAAGVSLVFAVVFTCLLAVRLLFGRVAKKILA